MSADQKPAPVALARRRRLAAPPPPRRKLPVLRWALVLCALAAIGGYAHDHWQRNRVLIRFAAVDGAMPPLEVTFYPAQLAFTAPSPPPPLGRIHLAGELSVAVAADLVPGRAVMTWTGPGIGAGYAVAELGRPMPVLSLRPPMELHGRVGRQTRLWGHGWTMAGLQPVPGAQVIALAGGEHGVPLAASAVDSRGEFRLPGLDSGLQRLTLRVRCPGHQLLHQEVSLPANEPLQLALVPTQPFRGRITAAGPLDCTGLRVLARGLPGIEAPVAADGSFALDHVADDTEPRLLLYGLPPTWAYEPVRATREAVATIELLPAATVRGRVVDHKTGVPMGGVLVWSGEGEPVRADENGRFVLERLLPGENQLMAQWRSNHRRQRSRSRIGSEVLQLHGGQCIDEVVIRIP